MATSLKYVIDMVSREEEMKKYPRKDIRAKDEKIKEEAKKRWPRTSATVWYEDLDIFKEIANAKFHEDPMNNAWQEAIEMWISANADYIYKKAEEKKKRVNEIKNKYE